MLYAIVESLDPLHKRETYSYINKLHIGHAKSICINFGLAKKYGGKTNLRFDDTNPTKEDTEYVEAIKEDIQWLGFQWGNEYYASDYFQQLWDFAVQLIKEGTNKTAILSQIICFLFTKKVFKRLFKSRID